MSDRQVETPEAPLVVGPVGIYELVGFLSLSNVPTAAERRNRRWYIYEPRVSS